MGEYFGETAELHVNLSAKKLDRSCWLLAKVPERL